MNTRITVKKVGNHWYPDIQHEFADEIELDEKVERVLNFLDKNHFGELEFYIYEQDIILDNIWHMEEADNWGLLSWLFPFIWWGWYS